VGFGITEGLAVYLNGTDLPDEVYVGGDVNELIAALLECLGAEGDMQSWWEGPRETALYPLRPVSRAHGRADRRHAGQVPARAALLSRAARTHAAVQELTHQRGASEETRTDGPARSAAIEDVRPKRGDVYVSDWTERPIGPQRGLLSGQRRESIPWSGRLLTVRFTHVDFAAAICREVPDSCSDPQLAYAKEWNDLHSSSVRGMRYRHHNNITSKQQRLGVNHQLHPACAGRWLRFGG
jgi:hypothetical protein